MNEVNWILDISTGQWTPGPSETTPEAESSSNTLSGGANVISCSGCSGGKAVGDIGGSSNGIIVFNNVSSTVSTMSSIRVHYENGDTTQRFASVSVNGGTAQVLAFLATADGQTPGTSVFNVQLEEGTANRIEFAAYEGGYGEFGASSSNELLVCVRCIGARC